MTSSKLWRNWWVNYRSSMGTICPNMNALEERGLTEIKLIDQRKQYRITALGKAHLKENEDMTKRLLNRFDTRKKIKKMNNI